MTDDVGEPERVLLSAHVDVPHACKRPIASSACLHASATQAPHDNFKELHLQEPTLLLDKKCIRPS